MIVCGEDCHDGSKRTIEEPSKSPASTGVERVAWSEDGNGHRGMTQRGSWTRDEDRGWVADVGGTNLRLALVQQGRGVTLEKRVRTPANKEPESILKAIRELLRAMPDPLAPSRGIVVGIPGLVDSPAGNVLLNANLGWHHVPIRRLAEEFLDMPVWVENDVRLHTLGEWQFGEGARCRTMADVVIGTGIAAGLSIHGQVLSGSVIGEIGHLTWDRHGILCGCGKSGCVETVVGTKGLRRLVMEMGHPSDDFVRDVVQPLERNEPWARRVWQEFSQALAFSLSTLVLGIHPEVIVLSGGIVTSFSLWGPLLSEALSHELFSGAEDDWQLKISSLGDAAPYLGGMALLFGEVWGEGATQGYQGNQAVKEE